MNRLANHLLLALTLCGCARPPALQSEGADASVQPEIPERLGMADGTAVNDVAADSAGPTSAQAECGNGVREATETCDGPDCPTSCPSFSCVRMELLGTATACDAACSATEITACMSGDGCCPQGCNPGSDADCSTSCGDGVVSGTERCEPGSSALPCPTPSACDDGDPCTVDKVIGSAQQCSAECAHMSITQSASGDRCCPVGAHIGTDADCEPYCGDGVVSDHEQCDPAIRGSCPTQATCDLITDGCSRGVLVGTGCNAHCEPETIRAPQSGDQCCPPGANVSTDSDCEPRCGDGVVSAREECDPNTAADDYGRCPASDSDCGLPASDPCLRGVLIGDPAQCSARCSFEPRETGPRDACCPSGASSLDDPDCAAVCGNGVLEEGETCDSGPGTTKPCPTTRSCSSELCNARTIVGSGCMSECIDEVIQALDGDGCCPSGATASSDNDCHDGAEGYWGECSWPGSYAAGWTEAEPLAPPSASRRYGCDGELSVCIHYSCTPTCEAGQTHTPDGWTGYCQTDAHPPVFEIFCDDQERCPAPRQCVTTAQNSRKLCR